jgi:hypothetical protein
MARSGQYQRIFVETYRFLEEDLKLGERLSSREILYLAHELVRRALNEELDASFREPPHRAGYFSRPVDCAICKSPFEVMAEESKNNCDGFGDDGYVQKGFRPKLRSMKKRRL